jgi:hypothetical protein
MNKRYTQKNKSGVRGKSTLLTGLEKMKMIRKQCTTTQKLAHKYDYEKGLNNMAKWLVAVTKCPPRHYGKVWNEEKEVIVRQCQDLYEEMQRFTTYQADSFMGDHAKRAIKHIPLSRMRYNMATAKWDFTNADKVGTDPYWNKDVKPGPVRQLTDLVQIRDALGKHDEDVAAKHVTTGPKVTQTYAEWRLASGLI